MSADERHEDAQHHDVDHQRVRALLGQHVVEDIPDDVVTRITSALAAEQAHRAAGDAKQGYDEPQTWGTFGDNSPQHYDKPGLGIEKHDSQHHPHLGRH